MYQSLSSCPSLLISFCSLIGALSLFVKAKPAEGLRKMKVGLRGARRLPDQIATLSAAAHTAKEVYMPALARVRSLSESFPRHTHSDDDVPLFYSPRSRHA